MEREKVVFPKIVPCARHNEFVKDCKYCKKINRIRKDEFLQELTWRAGKIIYKYWPEYIEAAQKKSKNDIQAAVIIAKKSITEQCYPWTNNSKTAKKIWDDTLSKLVRGMHPSFIPVVDSTLDIAKSKKTGQQIVTKTKKKTRVVGVITMNLRLNMNDDLYQKMIAECLKHGRSHSEFIRRTARAIKNGNIKKVVDLKNKKSTTKQKSHIISVDNWPDSLKDIRGKKLIHGIRCRLKELEKVPANKKTEVLPLIEGIDYNVEVPVTQYQTLMKEFELPEAARAAIPVC